MSVGQTSFENHLRRHQELIRERANDRLAKQALAAAQPETHAESTGVLRSLNQWIHQQFARPTHQPCPQPILRESDI
jgi:hypothetical protein